MRATVPRALAQKKSAPEIARQEFSHKNASQNTTWQETSDKKLVHDRRFSYQGHPGHDSDHEESLDVLGSLRNHSHENPENGDPESTAAANYPHVRAKVLLSNQNYHLRLRNSTSIED